MNNYTVSIGPWCGAFEVGLSAGVPAEQLHAFFEYKVMFLLRKLMHNFLLCILSVFLLIKYEYTVCQSLDFGTVVLKKG